MIFWIMAMNTTWSCDHGWHIHVIMNAIMTPTMALLGVPEGLGGPPWLQPSQTNWGQLGPNLAPTALRGPQGPPKGPFGAKTSPFGGHRGPLRGPSAWYGCVRPRRTVWKCFWCNLARLGCSQGSEGAKRGPKNENLHILAVLTPETAPGAVVIKT